MDEKVWFITGASRGFGLEIVREALARGDSVVAAARDPRGVERALGQRERLFPIELDVTNEPQAQAAATAALERFGQIDVLVNNAGRGLLGAVEEASAEDVRAVFDVNVDGLLKVTRAVLPSMRARRTGAIVNISSVGGFVSIAGWGVYCATKFAVEGLSEALRAELAPLGIRVLIVEPGAFRTDFLDKSSLRDAGSSLKDYAVTAGLTRQWAENRNHAQLGNPQKAAAAIVAASSRTDSPLRLQLGSDCIARVEAKLADVSSELSAWRDVALSTDHTEEANGPTRAREKIV